MPTKLARQDQVTLLLDYPRYGLSAGDIGVVVEVFDSNATTLAYQVEFAYLGGFEARVVLLLPEQIAPVEK